jgi:hypothetical protein
MINKKGAFPIGWGNITTLFWIALAIIVFFVIVGQGGIGKLSDIVSYLMKIPTIVWVILIIIVVLRMFLGGKK